MLISDVISTMVNRIVTKFQPTRIVLFGSRARGDAREFSDVDLLVVMNDVPNKRESAITIMKLLSDLPVSKDIIVSSVDEVAIRQQIVGTIEYEAFLEGKVLYEQP